MNPYVTTSILCFYLVNAACCANEPITTSTLWNVTALTQQRPITQFGKRTDLTQEIWYDGETLLGKPTRIFAYLGRPANQATSGTYPAMLLVHGGGGKAFREWTEHWANRGYVALAMDTAGQGPDGNRHHHAGPAQSDEVKFRNFEESDAREMWSYHAVATVLRGHGILKSLPDVDTKRIGITGISWGGYLTCLVAGLDKELKVAVPVYGCGFLHENSIWRDQRLGAMSADSRERWIRLFDPSNVVGSATCPMLFVNGMHDFAYPPDSHRKTYRLLPQNLRNISIQVELPHGHIWTFPEVDTFVDSALRPESTTGTLAKLSDLAVEGKRATAHVLSGGPPVKAGIHTTTMEGAWKDRTWSSAPAKLSGGTVSAQLPPERPITAFVTVIDSRGCVSSTPYIEIGH